MEIGTIRRIVAPAKPSRLMPNHFDRIASLLGIKEEQVPAFCNRIRAMCPLGLSPSNRDIAEAIQELGRGRRYTCPDR
jgi:hypothetical protein